MFFAMHTRRGLDRFVTFLDAIVAISVTLLILPLVDIGTAARAGTSVADLFREHGSEIYSFLLSFVVVMRFWLQHHRIFEHMKGYDRTVLHSSLVWALTIVVLPFATSLLPEYNKAVAWFYLGTLLLSSLSLTTLCVHVARTPNIRADEDGDKELNPTKAVANSVLLAIAFVVAVTIPAINYYALLILLFGDIPSQMWTRLRSGKRSSQVGDVDQPVL